MQRQKRHQSSAAHTTSRIRLTQRFLPWAAWLPFVRSAITLSLCVALALAGYQYFFNPLSAAALQFSTHVIGKAGDSVGILGVAVADLNGDGLKDVVVANSKQVAIYTHGGGHIFSKQILDDLASQSVAIADINNDGDPDIVVGLKVQPGVRWYRNNGGFNFTGFSLTNGSNGKVAVGDIDADGSQDIVALSSDESGIVALRRWMGNGHGTFVATILNGDTGAGTVAVGDVNDNKYSDILTGGRDGLQRWDTSNGTSWSRIDIDDNNKNSKTSIVVADMNNDSKFDIVVGDEGSNTLAVYKNLDNSSFQRGQLEGDADVGTVVPADLDNDGRVDIVATGQDDNSVFWFKNTGSLSFSKKTLVTGLQSVFGVGVADIDNDKDLDFVAADYWRGTLSWYEQTASKPTATKPTNITQSTNGKGLISFDTTLASDSFSRSRLRVEYSLNGTTWHKAYITQAAVSAGSADVKTSNGYQIGTSNGIDTDVNDTVTVTSTWDTASTLNAGGPLKGDVSGVQLRVTPRDDKATGVAVISSKFKVDRLAPQGLTDVNITSITTTEAILTWVPPKDSTSFTFALRYGTNADDVLDGGGELWDFNDDPDMNDLEGTTTTVKGLTANKTYTFKLFVTDTYGNTATSSAVAGITDGSGAAPSPTPTPEPGESPAFSATPTPIVPGGATPTSEPPTKPTPPPTTFENKAPTADAGLDQAVNPSALVILDGTASKDLDGDVLVYTWRQLSGASVDLLSSRTATPSFSAGKENETYIFALTVRDPKGASSTDIVTVATKQLPRGSAVPVAAGPVEAAPVEVDTTPPLVRVLRIVDLFFFALAVFFTMVSLLDRITRSAQQRGASVGGDSQPAARGRVVHYRTGEAIAGVQVLVYSLDGKLKSSERTNNRGEFSTLFPAGQYTIVIQAIGFAFAPAAGGGMMKPDGGVLYTGGTLTVQDGSRPLTITIPLKPMGQEISTGRTRLLHFWQSLQKSSRTLSWPVFLLGAILNTVLIFWLPTLLYLAVELSYVVLVIVKVALEVRVRPAYGMVRDAITHVPLDLAVVRLYEQGTNRMIMTRVTNSQGKFFALPPASTYTVTVTKPGYAVFSKQHVTIAPDQDSVLQITTDLMPVTPQSGLAMARAAVM